MPHEFNSLIQKDRQERRQERFKGTLLDYLAIVKNDPDVTMLAHERLQRLITAPGVKTIKTEEHQFAETVWKFDYKGLSLL